MSKLDDARNKINAIDREMARLFEERMHNVIDVINYKKENNLPIFDSSREEEVINNNLDNILEESIKPYYKKFIKNNMDISKEYQQMLLSGFNSNIIIKRGSLDEINKYFNLNRKVLILTDSGIPCEYYQKIKDLSKQGFVYIIKQGEASKNFDNYSKILEYMIENEFTRSDCVVACGGGVVGDLAGFVASTYMRGIEFYNFPTTLLSQVDSSIGGKTAIDMGSYKNLVGAFYNPSCVVIDSNVLSTLDERNLHAGLVEAIKMGVTNDLKLFELIEKSNNLFDDIDEIIRRALKVKNDVVFLDPKEKNIRRVLNFGHTIGHAIESLGKFNLLHGECIGLGMMYILDGTLKERVKKVLEKYNLPTSCNIDKDELYNYILRDKKRSAEYINIVKVEELGKYKFEKIKIEDIYKYL